MVLLSLLAACTEAPDTGAKDSADSGGTIDSTDTAPTVVDGVTVSPTDKETVFRVNWSTAEPGDGAVEYATDGSFDHRATAYVSEDGLEHSALLLLGEGETWTCRAVSTTNSGEWASDSFAVETPFAPTTMPALTLTAGSPEGLDGFVIITTALEGSSWVSIVDREGRRVWWEEGGPVDLITEAWLSSNGEAVVWNAVGQDGGFLHVETLDGSSHQTFEVKDSHHDFVPLPEGGYAILLKTHLDVDGVTAVGDAIAEIDETGKVVRNVWDVFQDFDVDASQLPTDGSDYDFSHANAITYSVEDDAYLISFYALSTVAAVSRASGALQWKLGGPDSSFNYVGDSSEIFARQHAARLVEGGILVFNNRDYADADDLWSEAVEYSLDFGEMSWQQVWSYDADESVYAAVLGNADRQGEGDTLVAFGAAGRVVEVTKDGEVLWQLDADLGGSFGYVHLLPELAGATR